MGHLIETLHGLWRIEKDKGTLDWAYFVSGAVIALLIVIAGFIYYKKGEHLKQLCSAKRGGKFLMPTAPPVCHAVPVKSGDCIHIQRDTSSPQQGANQQQEDQLSKPLIFPVFWTCQKSLGKTLTIIYVCTSMLQKLVTLQKLTHFFGRAVTIQDDGV